MTDPGSTHGGEGTQKRLPCVSTRKALAQSISGNTSDFVTKDINHNTCERFAPTDKQGSLPKVPRAFSQYTITREFSFMSSFLRNPLATVPVSTQSVNGIAATKLSTRCPCSASIPQASKLGFIPAREYHASIAICKLIKCTTDIGQSSLTHPCRTPGSSGACHIPT